MAAGGGAAAAGPDVPRSVPTYLSTVWLAVSEKLGRHPTIDYADCVLYNWVRIDPASAITPENIRLLNRFTGLMDEEWFLKTHVIIESEVRHLRRPSLPPRGALALLTTPWAGAICP